MTNGTLSNFCWSWFSFRDGSLGTFEALLIASFMHPFVYSLFSIDAVSFLLCV